jgi:hypothetical protein
MASVIRMAPDVVARAKAAGCTSAEIVGPYGRDLSKWRFVCSCGAASTQRRTEVLAFEALAHHLAKIAAAQVINGVSLRQDARML